MASEPIIGIDLGTFNSCVAMMDGNSPVVIANRGGYKTTPSMIAMTEAGRRLVGHIAKRQAVTNSENTVYAAKRLIGRKWDSAQVAHALRVCAYKIVQGPHLDPRIVLRDRLYSIPEISAMVLAEMKSIAEEFIGKEVHKAVITVPAYFNDGQRQATKDAGTIAGLDVVRIINEPTAAALAYGFGKHMDKRVAVFDLGGGTFDISVLDIGSEGVFRVVATAGDTFLGGEDFDQRITDWLTEKFQQEHGINLAQDRMAMQRMRDAAEKAKCELSTVLETEINLPFILSNARGEPLHLTKPLSRQQLEQLTQDLVTRTVEICQHMLKEANLDKDDIDEVVLVGGMTRMPVVQKAVARFFEREPNRGVHPDEVVALGAAIQGMALLDEHIDMVLLDVTPHKLGIMVAGGYFEELIPQNTTVPTTRSKVFTTTKDNQTQVKILVMQGDSEKADRNELLGEFLLTGLRSAKAGELNIEVTFEINADGIVSVSARDQDTQVAQSITITASSGLTSEEVERMVNDAHAYALGQKQSESMQKRAQSVETLIGQIEAIMPDVKQAVADSDFGQDSLDKASELITRARSRIAVGDENALTEIEDTLNRTLKSFRLVLGRA